jgi:DNA end-binding protein Ku
VNVPVKVYGAVEAKASVSFRELHVKDGAEVAHRLVGPDGEEVPRERVVKGFEVSSGEYVVLSNDEIKAADGAKRKAIELEEFVPADQIDPVFYGRPYNLAPQKDGEDAYLLLHDALDTAGRVGIGRVSLRSREQLVSVRPVDGVLRMQVMRFADELVPIKQLDIGKPSKAPGTREVDMAKTLVDTLTTEFKPGKYKDTYRERVLKIVEQKRKGQQIKPPKVETPQTPDDLAAALEASLKAMKK